MKHEIEIEGLPEGWEPVAYRHISKGDEFVLIEGEIRSASNVNKLYYQLIVKKKQPSEIVFRKTDEVFHHGNTGYRVYDNGVVQLIVSASGSDIGQPIWSIVKETDLSLHNADDNESLRLSVDELRDILDCKNTNGSGWNKVTAFLRDK